MIMKNSVKNTYVAVSLLIASVAVQSCSMESPFSEEQGVLQMKLAINSNVTASLTRAAMSDGELRENCVVYISNSKGLVFREKGLDKLQDPITLKQGHYVAEAWTGDSVPASYDSKFYRCYQPFDLGSGVNEVTLNCKIANVVTSVNASSIDDAQVKDLKITASTSNGSLEFTKDNLNTDKGYFMMPFDADGNRESELTIKVEGKNILEEPFAKSKIVQDVKPGYEYVVSLSYDELSDDPQGGGFLVVTIDETEIQVEDDVIIFAAPLMEGVDFDIDKQIIGEQGQFVGDRTVKVVAFDEISSFTIECEDPASLNLPSQKVDLKHASDLTIAKINEAGITWDKTVENVSGNDGHNRQLSYITFSEAYLNNLPERDTEYCIDLTATDGNGKKTSKTVRIAVGEDAIIYEDPIIAEDAYDPKNLMAIGAHSATLKASIKDDTATGLGIQYREVGTSEWIKVPANQSRATDSYVTIINLKAGTTYEYKAYADGFEASESKTFTTESIFTIPNASMEDWSDFSENSKVKLPGAGGVRTFWDSGNHGSSTMSVTLTQGSEDMKHSGNLSARLRSQFVGLGGVAGKFAAGNLFAGTYIETQGTDGRLEFGRPYNGSHPSKLRVYVNYRPGKVEKKGDYLAVGAEDIGQIYVALTTAPIEIRTKKSTQKLFPTEQGQEDYDKLVAYGEYTFEGSYGPDGELQMLEIPFEYFSNAKTVQPTHLVIVCSASKYGDFFNGGEGSLMYVDDFELVYE